MNLSLVQKFKDLNALVQEISQSPEFLEYCKQKSVGLTPENEDYAMEECVMFAIESSVKFFLDVDVAE